MEVILWITEIMVRSFACVRLHAHVSFQFMKHGMNMISMQLGMNIILLEAMIYLLILIMYN
jgi:hypothetical protein